MSLNINQHRNVLIKILKDIFTDIHIGPILGLKGGTAAYLFYGLDRFSVDLDFDLLDESKLDEVFDRVQTILSTYGRLKSADKKRYTLFYLLSYDNKDINAQNIKVEINRRNFGSKYSVESYLGISMKVMAREDMVAHKLVAMFERIGKANRDIYDVNYFLKNGWTINGQIVKERTGMELVAFLEQCIVMLENMDSKDILAGMGELLTEKQKAWVKTNLIADTIFHLKLEMNNIK